MRTLPIALFLLAACGPADPCRSSAMHLRRRYAERYIGHWVVAHGDTLTLPQMGDRFKLAEIVLDTGRLVVRRTCHFRGTLVFQVPPETLAVTWFGQPEQAIVSGWPADLGPFAGLSLAWAGRDSLSGSILLDSKLGVQARPGMTARFVAGRAQRLSSAP